MYLSITGVTSNKKLVKYQPFELEADAIAHATKYGGFSVADIGGNQEFWIVDKAKKTITQDTATENSVTAKRNASIEIVRLESTVTSRRLRDALANDEGKTWVVDVEKLIAVERAKL